MVWLMGLMQSCTDVPLCIDSPNAALLARILEEGHLKKPGMVNSVNEEGGKCETIFPLIAGTPWQVVGLTCDREGIPGDPRKKVDIAKRIIDKADKYGVAPEQLHIDPCVMALATMPTAMEDFGYCIRETEARHLEQFYAFVCKFRKTYPHALYLGAGGCRICGTCAFPQDCRFPEKAVSSMEAYGLFVTQVCRDAGVPYHYGERTVTYTACVLF